LFGKGTPRKKKKKKKRKKASSLLFVPTFTPPRVCFLFGDTLFLSSSSAGLKKRKSQSD